MRLPTKSSYSIFYKTFYSAITFGTIILLFIQIVVVINIAKFDLENVMLRGTKSNSVQTEA